MPDFSAMLQQGGAHAWLFAPAAILMGALHGLEPGHSKTMMAAFIIAVRGTVWQAVLLGLAATISHTAIVWIIALGGLYFGGHWNSEAMEPYLQLASAVVIIGVALWMLWRTWAGQHHKHDHHHHDDVRTIDTGAGRVTLEVHEDGVPPRWRLRPLDGAPLDVARVAIETERADGARRVFALVAREGYLESVDEIPEPHAFVARLRVTTEGVERVFAETFDEHDHDHHDGLDDEAMDAHQREHAEEIRRRFSSGSATTGQIVMFGLTGGLIPCPSSITILLLCLQLKQFTLGAALVLCFSVGLAVTMVGVGAAAALSVGHLSKRWSGFDALAARAPYLSVVLIVAVGVYTGWLGWSGLPA